MTVENLQKLLEIEEQIKSLKNEAEAIKDEIKKGNSFSMACEKAQIFSKMYLGMIEVGSRTGRMDEAMNRLNL